MKWFGWTLTVVSAMAGSAALSALVAFQYFVGDRSAFPGTVVLEHRYDPEQHSLPGHWLELRRRQLEKQPIYLRTPDDTYEYTFADLGVELDAAEMLSAFEQTARSGSPFGRLERALRARRGTLSVDARFSFDRERARALLKRLAPSVHRPAINAELDFRNHRRVESQSGRTLDLEATLRAIEQASLVDVPVVELALLEIAPTVTTDMLADIDVSKVLASFETSFRNKAGNRGVNIRRAAEYLDGTIVAPGAELSFNQVVGPREESRGFVWAPVIVNDEMEPGVGGGVCQVATTLHAAAVYGMLEVEQRRSHSRPSGYAPLGLDATVIYGKVDLKIKNPYDTALIVHAYLPTRTTLRVELLGRDPPGLVEHVYAVTEKHDFTRRVAAKSFLAPGAQERKQKGTPGYDVVSVVRVRYPDGTEKRRSYRSKYYPVPEVYWVSEGSDLSELPELPEGATHTEHADEPSADTETADSPFFG
ncbi:MAG TPA: VanW family protein [Polyangiaceae bacterium]